ncbi:MAG: hypothetical protein JXA20_10330 [Spirochaetes bacterium]|nr:hypothetical protein [Spirochaetota bacterium]
MSYYSITYAAAEKTQYTIKCVKCGNTFVTRFPLADTLSKEKPTPPEDPKNQVAQAPQRTQDRLFPALNREAEERRLRELPSRNEQRQTAGLNREAEKAPASDSPSSVIDFLSIGISAFSLQKLAVATVGVFSLILVLILYNIIVGLFYNSENPFLSSIMNLFPLAIVFFAYMIIASIIARIHINEDNRKAFPSFPDKTFIARAVASSSVMNIALLLIVDLLLILFGELPIIGPILFSLLFLPIYAVSVSIVILFTVGLWFFPSIIADTGGTIKETILSFANFVRRHNFSLIYTVLLLTIGTSMIFAAIYLLHYGALSLAFFLSQGILSEEGMKVFSAVPVSFLRISDMSIISANVNLFHTLIRGLFVSHHIGGIILGTVFSAMTVALMAVSLSVVATISTSVYMIMRDGTDMDDSRKIRMLIILALVMAILFLFKKLFF